LRFASETAEHLRVSRTFVEEKLEGDKTMEARIFCFVNNAHATGTEFLDDVKVRDGLTDQAAVARTTGLSFLAT
jgi:hypothetical protein